MIIVTSFHETCNNYILDLVMDTVCLGEASVSNTTSCSTSIAWPWGKLNPNDAVTLTMKNFITNKRVLTNTVRRSDGHQTKVDVLPATAYEVKIHSLTAYCDPIYFLTPGRSTYCTKIVVVRLEQSVVVQ